MSGAEGENLLRRRDGAGEDSGECWAGEHGSWYPRGGFHSPTIVEMTAFYFLKNRLAMPCSMWDLNSPTRDQTHIFCVGSMES